MNIQLVQTPKEKQDAFSVRFSVFVEEQGVPEEIELDEHDDEAIHFICYASSGNPIAASRIRFTDNAGKLERICVVKDYRGHSIGSKLIQLMEETILEKDVHIATLHAQTHATEFYKRLGYRVTSEPFMDAGISHVAMEKHI